MHPETLLPFEVHVPQAQLDDLRDRLDATRWVDDVPGAGWDLGVPAANLRRLVAHWTSVWDWRAWEARLAEVPQFVTTVDGQRVHLVHLRSPEPGARPLLLTHGWPGSVLEFLDVLGPLTDPRGHGGDPADAFHVVVPSLPGTAWSGPTHDRGWGVRRIAAAWLELMTRLGYPRFAAAGNDWGCDISLTLARLAPDRCLGVHATQLVADAQSPDELEGLSRDEGSALAERRWVERTFGTYHLVHAQQPQTLAHALADSPAGHLGWLCQMFRDEDDPDPDLPVTFAATQWLTGTVASSLRLYWEAERDEPVPGPTPVPVGLSQFANDYRSIRRFASREHPDLRFWREHDVGSHWAARSAPGVYVDDVRDFFRPLR